MQKKTPDTVSQITENQLTRYPNLPSEKSRSGNRERPFVARMPCGTTKVIFSRTMAVLTIELKAAVLAM
jgi:hypothetical protein